ncbi:MAG: hypothetical protein GY870_09900 [archaeon]|nr:hypothetical protein [archaeon]
MNNNIIEKQNQIINFDKLGKLSEYFAKFKIGTLFWERMAGSFIDRHLPARQ